ncbi:MAG TPA: DUF748 domain-containing protein [Burkholderiales bacterium]
MRALTYSIAGLLLLVAVAGFVGVPPIARSQLETRLSATLHRPVTVEAVRFNPFAPSITVRGVVVREREGTDVFAGFDELYVNGAWTSIFRLAPVADEITLVKPRVHVVRGPDGKYNFQDLVDELVAQPKSEGPPARFALFNLRLLEGRLDFDDRLKRESHSVTDLRIGIPFLSSLPRQAEIKVLPEVSAKVDGAAFALGGDTLPFAAAHTTNLKLDLEGFDLTKIASYVPFEPRAKLQSALLDTRLVLAFEQPPGKGAELKLRGAAALRNVALNDAAGRPALGWRHLAVELNEVEPLVPRIDLKSLELDGADVILRREKSGALNLAQLGPVSPKDQPQKTSEGPTLALNIDRLALNFDRFAFSDQATSPAFGIILERSEIRASNVGLQKDKRSEWTLAAHTSAGETVKAAASMTLAPFAASGRVDIAGADLRKYQPYIDQAANLRIDDGKADLGLAFKTAAEATALEDIALAVRGLRARLPDDKQPFVRLGSLQLNAASADLAARTVSLGKIAIDDVALDVRRAKDGTLNVVRIARAVKGNEVEGKPWRIDVPQASLSRGTVSFEDQAPGEPVKLRIAPIELKAERLSTAKGQRGNVSLRATIDKRGTLAASGPVALDPLSARLNVTARTIGFAPLQPYIEEKLRLAVTSGALSANGAASIDLPAGAPLQAAYKGDVVVTDFASVDKESAQDLVKWKSLSLGAIDFQLEPLKVSLGEIALSDYYARVILSPQGRLNLQELVVAGNEAPPAEPKSASVFRIGRISVQGGNVNFSDYFVKPNYTANLTGLGGAVSEMNAEKAGEVELRGKLDDAAPVEVTGQVNPLAPDLVLHLKGNARDIDLPQFSPYSVKYAGYGIERGKLSLRVQYDVEKRQLSADNQIYLDQLTFGERVESETATKLPVTLAVALLKDRNGVIDVSLPVSGSLDDPQFSIGGVIVRVIMNLIVKAVTAPFALLGQLFGGGGEQLAYLEFAPGSAALAPAGQSKLKTLAGALTERPGLKLDISGRAAPDADREGLKRAAIDRKVRAQKFNDLRRGAEAPASLDDVKVAPAEYEKYLRRAYREEKFPKPRNAIGLVKDLPVAEMENLMITHTPVGEDDLRSLANERAQAAREWLVEEAKVPAERVFMVAPRLTAEGIKDSGQPTRVDFSLK